MPTRNVVLTDHQHQLINDLVASGQYQNASEVLRDGLRLVEDRRNLETEKLRLLRAAVQQGWDDEASGRFVEIDVDELDDLVNALGHRQRPTTA